MKKQIYGIAGGAGVGKDTLCQNLIPRFKKDGKKAKRFALADELKNKIRQFCLEEFEIDILHCDRNQKDFLRPMLVCYGKLKRSQTYGTYWTSLLEDEILKDDCDIAIVTDIRYFEYVNDEVMWIKQHMNGKLIHLSRFDVQENGDKIFLPYPNEEEAKNDPLIKEVADFKFEWPSFSDISSSLLSDAVDKFYKSISK